MAFLSLALIVIGVMVLSVGAVWFVVNAFRTSVLWGICVCLFTPAWIRFCWRHWDMASQPFLITLVGVALSFGGAQLMPADAAPAFAGLAQPLRTGKLALEPKKKPELPPMFAAQKDMELKLKLVALSRKESDLRDRKATIDPKNQQEAQALVAEINKYNAELQPVLLEMKERGITPAQ